MKWLRKSKSQKGQSLVEFTVMVMVLMLIVSGIVDLGRMFIVYINLRDAAEEGVVYGSLTPTDCSGIESRVLENVNNISGVDISTLISGIPCESAAVYPETYAILGNEIRVTVTLEDFPISMPLMGALIGQTIDVDATITGTILRPLSPTPVP